jgi:hypothetical protein
MVRPPSPCDGTQDLVGRSGHRAMYATTARNIRKAPSRSPTAPVARPRPVRARHLVSFINGQHCAIQLGHPVLTRPEQHDWNRARRSPSWVTVLSKARSNQ